MHLNYKKINSFTLIIFYILLLLSASCQKSENDRNISGQISHHVLEVTMDPANHTLNVTDEMSVKMPDGVNVIDFMLNKSIGELAIINSSGFELEKVDVEIVDPSIIETIPEIELNQYDLFRVTVEYPDSVVKFMITYNGIVYDTLNYANANYARGFAKTSGLIDERGVYLGKSSAWYPIQGRELVTFKIRSFLPLGWHSISQGVETIRGTENEFQVNEWECEKPMESIYLICGQYIITEESVDDKRILTYMYEDEFDLSMKYIDATKRYIQMYERLIGPFPYKKFSIVENFWQTGYGMPSFTLLGSKVIRLPFMIYTSLGHEILHNWWGNSVYVDPDDGNWCEGITTYMADHYYKKMQNADIDYRRDLLIDYLNYVEENDEIPLSQFRERHDQMSQAVGYAKSCMVFHMLQSYVGERMFRKAFKLFYKDHVFSFANWDDIKTSFEKTVSGKQFDWFFEQWVYKKGAPKLTLADISEYVENDSYFVDFSLEMSEPVYKLNVPVRMKGDHDTTFCVDCSDRVTKASFRWKKKPVSMQIDPDYDVFRRLDRMEIPPTLGQIMGDKDLLVIVPESYDSTRIEVYEKFIRSVCNADDIVFKTDSEIVEDELDNVNTWIISRNNSVIKRLKLSDSLPVKMFNKKIQINDKSFYYSRYNYFITVRNPFNSKRTIIISDLSKDIYADAMSRKIPHYGRYSYLVFRGHTNVYKGKWEAKDSPLLHTLNFEQ